MLRILIVVLATTAVLNSPAEAASKKTKNAAAVGAGVGLVTGGVSGAAKGAVVGGGAGAYANADKGDKAKKDAKKAAAVGAGVGLLTDGVSGAAKGAVYGGAGGALYGEHKDKKKKKKKQAPRRTQKKYRYRDASGHKTSLDWIRQMLKQVRRWYRQHPLVLIVDGGLAALGLGWRCVAIEATMVSRLRWDAALYHGCYHAAAAASGTASGSTVFAIRFAK